METSMNKKQEKVPGSDAKIISDGEDGTKLYNIYAIDGVIHADLKVK